MWYRDGLYETAWACEAKLAAGTMAALLGGGHVCPPFTVSSFLRTHHHPASPHKTEKQTKGGRLFAQVESIKSAHCAEQGFAALTEISILHWYVSVNINYDQDLPMCWVGLSKAGYIKYPFKIFTVSQKVLRDYFVSGLSLETILSLEKKRREKHHKRAPLLVPYFV